MQAEGATVRKIAKGICLSCGKECLRHINIKCGLRFDYEEADKQLEGMVVAKCKFCVHGEIKLESVLRPRTIKNSSDRGPRGKLLFGAGKKGIYED